jgi:phage tail sheath protein FI
MPQDYHHGVRNEEVTVGPRTVSVVATSIIGLVAIASDADAQVFPLNTPVLVTNVKAAIANAGVNATLKKALSAIGEIVNPVIAVVRVAAGVGVDAQEDTDANVVAGLQALLTAKALLGVKPRIIVAPGLATDDVKAAMATVAGTLNGMAYAKTTATEVADAITERDDYSARELMLVYGDFSVWAGEVEARAAGLRAYIDQTMGYHKTLSNVAVPGVTGIDPATSVTWDLQETGTEADLLNEAGITCLVRHNGFRFWGSRTCSDDANFIFESAVRTAQVLKDTCAEGLMWAADKPLHPSLGRDILETVNDLIRRQVRAGYLIGGRAFFDADANASDNLAAGKLVIDFDYTPCPPLEDLQLRQQITDRYFEDFANRVNFSN